MKNAVIKLLGVAIVISGFNASAWAQEVDPWMGEKAHGTREMPIWGLRYAPGPTIAERARNFTYEPLLAIVDYLNRIQQK
jgi:hypothetical protein